MPRHRHYMQPASPSPSCRRHSHPSTNIFGTQGGGAAWWSLQDRGNLLGTRRACVAWVNRGIAGESCRGAVGCVVVPRVLAHDARWPARGLPVATQQRAAGSVALNCKHQGRPLYLGEPPCSQTLPMQRRRLWVPYALLPLVVLRPCRHARAAHHLRTETLSGGRGPRRRCHALILTTMLASL